MVHYYWLSKGCHVWQCGNDPIESAHKWCQENGNEENVEAIEMGSVPYAQAFMFVVKDFMEKWAHNTDSFLVNSTCE